MGDPYVSIGKVSGGLEADIIKTYFESLDIPCVLSEEAIGRVYGFGVGPLAEVEIFVPSGLEKEARQALEEYWQSKGEADLEDEPGGEVASEE